MITAEDFKKLKTAKRKAHKYGAIRCQRGEIKFPSKLERAYYDHLLNLQKIGNIKFFLRQVPFHLPGGVKYVCDFVLFREFKSFDHFSEMEIQFIDVKGKETAVYKMKKKIVEELYPIKIIEIKKGDF